MDKSFVKNVIAVLLGIALVIMVYDTFSLITGAVLFEDLAVLEGGLNDLEAFMKWSAVSLACMLIPALVSYVIAFIGNKKQYMLISAILSFLVVICCLIFFGVTRAYAIRGFSSSRYATGTTYLSELVREAVSAALAGVYFLITFLRLKNVQNSQQTVEEGEGEED